MLGVRRNEIQLVPYNPIWAALFQESERDLRQILGSNVIGVQHVGSTAIPGVVAKPILDIAVVVRDLDALEIKGMQNAGFQYRGEAGIPGRAYFVKYRNGDISTHHIHCYEQNNPNLLANIAFRDYLIAHPEYAERYSELKQQLARQYPGDRATYTDQKTDFVQMILQLARTSS